MNIPPTYVTIIVGIIAALTAAIVNIVIVYFRNKADHHRELVKLAKELAVIDLEDARIRHSENKEHVVRPTSSYVWYYFRFLKMIDKNDFDKEEIKKNLDDYGTLLRLYEEHSAHQSKKE